jgi:hypothetical protein
MNRIALTLIGSAMLALAGCDGTNDSLTNGSSGVASETAFAATDNSGGGPNGENHSQDPNGADPQASMAAPNPDQKRVDDADTSAGSPSVQAQLHGCAKITVASLQSILTTRGVSMNGTAEGLYKAGLATLGQANYASRVPEASFATTSGMTKQMDIFAAASSEVTAAAWNPSACQSNGAAVKLFDGSGKFTADGISCLLGKPARQEYIDLANAAVTQASTTTIGQQLAVSALLSAAHTCE